MTNSESSRFAVLKFEKSEVDNWVDPKGHHHDWPVVYLLQNDNSIYVGESTRARNRLQQHLKDTNKSDFEIIRVILNEKFNKSVCLDLESKLISWFHADSKYQPVNRNDGQQNSNYFERELRYQPLINEIFQKLKCEGLFTRTIPQLENLNIFKLSPFKALNDEQLVAVDGIVEGLLVDIENNKKSVSVVQGGPGTGKTIVAIFLLKLLKDIQQANLLLDVDEDGRFSDFFVEGYKEILEDKSIGFVVPQQSLRKTIQNVFKKTPSLQSVEVLSPYKVANEAKHWDMLIVDETHRLTHRGSGPTRGQFSARNKKLFGDNADGKTSVDWVKAKANHSIFLIDGNQTVRPADVPKRVIDELKSSAHKAGRLYNLESQMRVNAGADYLRFAQSLLTDNPTQAPKSNSYDLRFFESFPEFVSAIYEANNTIGLSRIVAGYAWKWLSKDDVSDQAPFDIEIENVKLRWNRTAIDWIASESSSVEVGSVHTVQGYDLNYAGVIIGPDIIWDEQSQSIKAVRESHFDTEVRTVKDPDALLEYIRNAYYVLLTRGILGTYIYACDPALRVRLRSFFSLHKTEV